MKNLISKDKELFDPVKGSLVRIGGIDTQSLYWAKILGINLEYVHTVKVEYTLFSDSEKKYFSYYGCDSAIEKINSSYRILPYPGDRTIKIYNDSTHYILFEVISQTQFDREFNGVMLHRLPLIGFNDSNEKIFKDEVEVGLNNSSNNKLTLLLIHEGKSEKINFSGDSTAFQNKDIIFSHFDQEEEKIYYYDRQVLKHLDQLK